MLLLFGGEGGGLEDAHPGAFVGVGMRFLAETGEGFARGWVEVRVPGVGLGLTLVPGGSRFVG